MAIVLSGSLVRLYINGNVATNIQQVSYNISYDEELIYGIDTNFAQEIAPNRYSVNGSVTGLRISVGNGLEGLGAVPLLKDLQSSNYISLRITNVATGQDILDMPNCKIKDQNLSTGPRRTVQISFNFTALQGYSAADRFSGS